MGAITSAASVVGSQIPIPPSVNQDSANNPISDLNTQKELSGATNAGSAASNAAGTGESFVQGIVANLNPNLGPTTKA